MGQQVAGGSLGARAPAQCSWTKPRLRRAEAWKAVAHLVAEAALHERRARQRRAALLDGREPLPDGAFERTDLDEPHKLVGRVVGQRGGHQRRQVELVDPGGGKIGWLWVDVTEVSMRK